MHKQTVRLTIDFPVEQHTFLKMMAAKEGVSMRKFVIEHLPYPTDKKDNKEFSHYLDEIIDEYSEQLKSLSKK